MFSQGRSPSCICWISILKAPGLGEDQAPEAMPWRAKQHTHAHRQRQTCSFRHEFGLRTDGAARSPAQNSNQSSFGWVGRRVRKNHTKPPHAPAGETLAVFQISRFGPFPDAGPQKVRACVPRPPQSQPADSSPYRSSPISQCFQA